MYGFQPVSSINMWSQELPIFRQFCNPLRNFATKTFQLCSQRASVMGGLQGGFDFFELWLCYLQDWLFNFSVKSFCEKVWLSWVPYVKFGLYWLSRLKFWLIWNDIFYGIWLLWPIFWQNVLDLPPFRTLIMLLCDLWLFCKQERIINETSIDCAKKSMIEAQDKINIF